MEATETETVNIEPVTSKMIGTEPLNTEETPPATRSSKNEASDPETRNMEPVSTELINSEPMSTGATPPTASCSTTEGSDAETRNTEAVNIKPVSTELNSTEPTNIEATPSTTICSTAEASDPETRNIEVIKMDPVSTSETRNMEVMNMESVTNSGTRNMENMQPLSDSGTRNVEVMNMEPVSESETRNMEVMNMEPVSESEARSMQVMNMEPVSDSETRSMEVMNMEPVSDSETRNIEVMNMEPVSDSETRNMEVMNMEPVSAEMIEATPSTTRFSTIEACDSKTMNMELVNMEPVGVELISTKPMNTEATPQTTRCSTMEVCDSETMNMELMDMEPVSAEMISIEPINTEATPSTTRNSTVEGSDFETMNMEIMNMEPVSTELINTEATPPTTTRRRKKKSMVWEHFTVEVVSGECTRACCKLCKQTFAYSNGSKVAGTSHLKRHIALGSCPKIKSMEKQQLALASGIKIDGDTADPPKRRYRTSNFHVFDQDQICTYLAKMIIMHEYPLHMVENPAFLSFVQSLQPRFKMIDVNAMEGEILSVYHKEKQNLVQSFETMPGRISLTIGLWSTSQTLGYICLSGQYIDSDWKLNRRMLSFMMVSSPHSENALSEAISVSLSDWNLKDKLFTITLDNNCSSHDIYSANLRDYLSNKNTLMLKGQLFVVRCYANILNVVAQDLIASIHGIVYNIRESVKFVKASPAREEKFSEIALQIGVPGTKALSLDVTTLWNTTYVMLDAALEYKEAFTFLETCDDNYNEAPSSDDWKRVEVACTFLKLLYDSANTVMATIDQTANIFFQEAWKVQLELTNATSSQDTTVSSIAKEIHEKFDKYWKDCSLVLAIAVVMDPRFKMKLVEFSFSKIYGEDSARYVKVVNDSIHELYLEYAARPLRLVTYVDQGDANHMDGNGNNPPATANPTGDGLLDFDIFLSEMAVNQPTKSELDQYLEESLLPRMQGFDILNWWKLNNIKYPTLSKMARDLLSIPVSMVGTGCSIFGSGTGNRMLDDYRSSLRPETVEALFCAKDWLQYLPTMTETPATAIVKMDF